MLILTRLVVGCLLALPSSVSLNKNLNYCLPLWQKEARTQLSDPVVLAVHGGKWKGEWYAFPDHSPPIRTDLVALALRVMYPGRAIVLMSCNESGCTLHVHGVWYCRRGVVWCEPGMFKWRPERGSLGLRWTFGEGRISGFHKS